MPKGVLELEQNVLAKLNLMAQGMNQTPETVVAAQHGREDLGHPEHAC